MPTAIEERLDQKAGSSAIATDEYWPTLERYLVALLERAESMSPSDVRQRRRYSVRTDDVYVGLDVAPDTPSIDRRFIEGAIDRAKREVASLAEQDLRDKMASSWAERYDVLSEARELADADRLPAENTIQEHRFVVVLGHPGAGKTTMLNHLALDHARAILKDRTLLYRDPDGGSKSTASERPCALVPIVLKMSSYAEARQSARDLSLIDYLARYVRGEFQLDVEESLLARTLGHWLRRGRCLIMLDGVDEIPTQTERKELVQAIEAFVRAQEDHGVSAPAAGDRQESNELPREQLGDAPITARDLLPQLRSLTLQMRPNKDVGSSGNRFLVTSRIAGYRNEPLSDKFRHFTILELSGEVRKKVIQSWCRAITARAMDASRGSRRPEDAGTLSQKVVDAFNTDRSLSAMAGSPLLVRIIAEVFHANPNERPRGRADFYERAVRTLLTDWNLERGAEGYVINFHDAVAWLGPLALWIHEHMPTGMVSRRRAEEVIAQAIAVAHTDAEVPRKAGQEAAEFVDRVREGSGIFVELGADLYGFAHRTSSRTSSQKSSPVAEPASGKNSRDAFTSLAGGNQFCWRSASSANSLPTTFRRS